MIPKEYKDFQLYARDKKVSSSDLDYYAMSISTLADMDAGDTATLRVDQQSGTAQTDLSANCLFSGVYFVFHL